MGMTVEGVRTAEATYQLAEKWEVEMPITSGIYEVIFHDKHPKDVVDKLMQRNKTNEMEDIIRIWSNRYSH